MTWKVSSYKILFESPFYGFQKTGDQNLKSFVRKTAAEAGRGPAAFGSYSISTLIWLNMLNTNIIGLGRIPGQLAIVFVS